MGGVLAVRLDLVAAFQDNDRAEQRVTAGYLWVLERHNLTQRTLALFLRMDSGGGGSVLFWLMA